MQRVGFFQVVYTTYKTSTNKDRIKKQFIFLDEITTNSSYELFEMCKELHNRYKTYNNIITLDYDRLNNCYIFNKSKLVSLKLTTNKDILQDGEKIEILKGW